VLSRCAKRTDHTVPCRSSYRGSPQDDAWLAIVHVPPHSRQRQNVVTLIVFASVSMVLPVQKGHLVGRETSPSSRDSDILPLCHDLVVRGKRGSRGFCDSTRVQLLDIRPAGALRKLQAAAFETGGPDVLTYAGAAPSNSHTL
jgi:hypothetical protein